MSPATPEEALAEGRRRASEASGRGDYSEAERLTWLGHQPRDEFNQLYDWAHIEPDLGQVRSTRRMGAPVTAVKRGLLRALRQYHNQLIGQLVRFNHQLLVKVARLESRIERLEQQASGDDRR